jgi:hypothetical protein
LGQPLYIKSVLTEIIRDILENAVIPCPKQGLGRRTQYLGQNRTAQTSQRNNKGTWTWTLMASHTAKKYTHFWTCSIHNVFEQLILPASVVVDWVTDHIYLQVLIFHLLVSPLPNKFNYFQSHTAKLPCMKGYCIWIMTSTCTAWSGGGNFPVLVPITGQWKTAILQCS